MKVSVSILFALLLGYNCHAVEGTDSTFEEMFYARYIGDPSPDRCAMNRTFLYKLSVSVFKIKVNMNEPGRRKEIDLHTNFRVTVKYLDHVSNEESIVVSNANLGGCYVKHGGENRDLTFDINNARLDMEYFYDQFYIPNRFKFEFNFQAENDENVSRQSNCNASSRDVYKMNQLHTFDLLSLEPPPLTSIDAYDPALHYLKGGDFFDFINSDHVYRYNYDQNGHFIEFHYRFDLTIYTPGLYMKDPNRTSTTYNGQYFPVTTTYLEDQNFPRIETCDGLTTSIKKSWGNYLLQKDLHILKLDVTTEDVLCNYHHSMAPIDYSVIQSINSGSDWAILDENLTSNSSYLDISPEYLPGNHITDGPLHYTDYFYRIMDDPLYFSQSTSHEIVTTPTNCMVRYYSQGILGFRVYPAITAFSLKAKSPCISDFKFPLGRNFSGNIMVDESSVEGGKPGAYKYSIWGLNFKPVHRTNLDELETLGEAIESLLSSFTGESFNDDPILGVAIASYASTNGIDLEDYRGGNVTTNSTGIFSQLPVGIYRISVSNNFPAPGYNCPIYKWVVIYPQSNPVLSISPDEVLCPNDNLELVATSDKPVNWQWVPSEVLNEPYEPNQPPTTTSTVTINTYSGQHFCSIKVQAEDVHGCKNSIGVDIPDFSEPPYVYRKVKNVVNVGASSLTGIWLNDFSDLTFENATAYNNAILKNPYETGQAGLYRSISAFDYLDLRKESFTPGTDIVGTTSAGYSGVLLDSKNPTNLNEITLFNWSNPKFTEEYEQWVKNNEATRYNGANEPVEDKDILNTYSAALFGFKGTLPVAVAVNSQNEEIAFESFEEYTPDNGVDISQVNNSTGNFDLVEKMDAIEWKKYDKFSIVQGSGRYIKTNIPANEYDHNDFEDYTLKILARSPEVTIDNKAYGNDENLFDSHGEILETQCLNPDDNVLTIKLDEGAPGIDLQDNRCRFWYGDIYVQRTVPQDEQSFIANGAPRFVITNGAAHTGKNSYRVAPSSSETEIEQVSIRFTAGYDYVLSGWIRTDKCNEMPSHVLNEFNANNKIGIIPRFYNVQNQEIPIYDALGNAINFSNGYVFAKGPSINGWQKFDLRFSAPEGAAKFKLVFANTYLMWVDDVRLCPFNGNIQTYVYDPLTYKQVAVLDQNNFSTMYKYDEEGKLFQLMKETIEGIKTLQVKQSYMQHNK